MAEDKKIPLASIQMKDVVPVEKPKKSEPIKVSGPHLEDPIRKKLAELRAETKDEVKTGEAVMVRSVQYSNHYILGWLIDRINNLEDAEAAREVLLVAAEKSAHEGLRRVAEELKADLERREALYRQEA